MERGSLHPLPPLLLCAALLAGAPLSAQDTTEPRTDWTAEYERLLAWRYAAEPTPIPAGGLTFARDSATWTLASGSLRLAEPTSTGAVTGFVFEGDGTFRMEVPDPVERNQLRRFTKGEASEVLEAHFSKLVVRTAHDLPESVAAAARPGGGYERSGLAAERHAFWLEHYRQDADARVIAGLLTPGDELFLAEMETGDHGWLTYELEPWSQEEIELHHLERGSSESWVSLDRAEDRGPDGRPGTNRRDAVRVRHADVRGDFTAPGDGPRQGVTRTHPRLGKLSVDVILEARVSGPEALRLSLTPWAEVQGVRLDGREAPWIRHHVGGRKRNLDNDLYDNDLLVLLPAPLEAGAEHTVTVDYELEVLNYLSGRTWYPEEAHSYLEDRHTGSFEVTLPERIDLRAMGRREGEPVIEGRTRTERWVVDEPTFMLSFTFAERPREHVLEREGRPTVSVFGPGQGKGKFESVAADVADAIAYFEDLFGMPLGTDLLRVSSIVAGHGQAFQGFLHLGENSFHVERGGASEVFRAHETAHEWWGHRVAWASYRDQWLSEAFAEYSALMFLQATLENGEKHFDEALFAYGEALQGSIKAGYSRFRRTRIVPLNPKLREEVGPIAVGWRAATADAPNAYVAQAYLRGPWVLHMLRGILRDRSGDDDLFVQVLSDFLHRFDGRAATTRDFIDSLTETAGGEWDWFFDQWVYDTTIPTYAWDWKAETGEDGGHVLAITVRQEDAPDGFRMPVPVTIDFGGQTPASRVVLEVDEREETFRIPVPAQPRKVGFNSDRAVLAKVKGL